MRAPGVIDLDCGIACARIEGWLRDELALERDGATWRYPTPHGSCNVTATPLEGRPLATLRLPRTHLVATGDDEALDAFDKAFTLRFMSAGG